MAYFDGTLPEGHPFRHLSANLPGGDEAPDFWVLGSSADSAELAGMAGLPYCIADFIAGEVPSLAERYRRAFRPSARAAAPVVMVACWTVAAEDAERAAWLAGPSRMMLAHLLQGQLIAVPSPERAAAWLADNPVPMPANRRPITGDATACRAQLQAKADLYGADELMLVNILHDHQDRLQSYRLIADAMIGCEPVPA
jgi:luciferase family oxidoreductase group 1